MRWRKADFSSRGRARIYLVTALGTLVCIAVAFFVDSYSFETGAWRWGEQPVNNVIIPLLLAPPFFYVLLGKMRDLAIAHHELMNVASTDSLTACLNRRAFTALVDGYLDRLERAARKPEGALLVIDVDHFKRVNDRFGHDRGDDALISVARAIKSSVRDIDLVARLGGEEFGVFLPGLETDRAETVAERIRLAVQGLDFTPAARRYGLSVSVGGAVFGDRSTFSELYRVADQRLYAAKKGGRNRIEISYLSPGDPLIPLGVH